MKNNTTTDQSTAAPPVVGSQTAPLPADAVPGAKRYGARERFCRACRCLPVDHAPVWMMRQAGRALPEYREMKQRYTFTQMVQTPDLALEVTLQPIRRFGFDAAILFSDILVIPEALGQPYHFQEGGGIRMEYALRSAEDIRRLNVVGVCARLSYVLEALRLIRLKLDNQAALIGFSGSPWTLANFMIEGGSSKDFTRALELKRSEPVLFGELMAILTRAVIDYLRMQMAAGVDALQIFDTLGGLLPPEEFQAGSGIWMKQIIAELGPSVPVIVFSRGTHSNWNDLAATGARVLGIDHGIALAEARRHLPATIALQGNLDPKWLSDGTAEQAAEETRRVVSAMQGRSGHIFNLGHGVPPTAKLENIEAVVAAIRNPL